MPAYVPSSDSPFVLKSAYRGLTSLARKSWVQVACGVAAFALVLWFSWLPKAIKNRPAHPVKTLGVLPLSFEANRGQAPADAKFVARGAGYALLLTDRGEPLLHLHGKVGGSSTRRTWLQRATAPKSPRQAEIIALRLHFTGGNAAPALAVEEPLRGRSNYLIGNDPQKWLINVPHFARVRYREVYPGIDVLYYANQRQLEYDFIVQPGADPRRIRFSVEGADKVEVSKFGNLVLHTRNGRVLLQKPVAYQEGPAGQQSVECSYLLDANGEAAFELAEYDSTKVLRIDPVLSYAAQFDGFPRSITLDSGGNSYITGFTFSGTFTTTAGAVQTVFGGNGDAFIAKLDPSGSTLLFATYLGGNDFDLAAGIALDGSNNIVVSGFTLSTNFPVTNAFQSAFGGGNDAFLTKLNPAGTQILYSTYLGGTRADSASAVALDSTGRAVIAGFTDSGNFPTTAGAFRTLFSGGGDAFVAKLDTTMVGPASLVYSTYLGGGAGDGANAIAVDSSDNAYITGATTSANFPTATPIQMSYSGNTDAFVTKLNAAGSALVYSTFLGGGNQDIGNGIAVDSSNNAYVAGSTFSANFPVTPGVIQPTYGLNGDAFVTKVNAAGSANLYSTYLGGSDFDRALAIALDTAGNAYLTGDTQSANFPVVNPVQAAQSGGTCYYYDYYYYYPCADVVVPQVNAAGSALIYSTYLGGGFGNDRGIGIAVDGGGIAHVVGDAAQTFPFTPNSLQMSGGVGFAAKISPQSMPGFSFGTSALNFPTTPNGSNSMLTVLIHNLGSATLNVTSISTTANFIASQNCLPSVASGATCPVTVTFSPSSIGPFAGTLTVVDDAAGSPHILMLSGTGGPAVTSTVLVSSMNPSVLGQSVTFTATVSSSAATGMVNFLDGNNIIGTGTLTAGVATFGTAALTAGNHSITAAYTGDANFAASTSSPLTQTVNKLPSSTTLASSLNPSNTGQSVTFTATVTPSTATGSVAFLNGTTSLGTGTLANGSATFSTSTLPVGNHSITASYAGDASFNPSTSAAVMQGVNGVATSAASTTATVSSGGTANFTMMVTQNGLTAPITFACAGLPTGGTCTFNPSSVPAASGTTSVSLAIAVGTSFAGMPIPLSSPSSPAWQQLAGVWLALLTLGTFAAARHKRAGLLRTALPVLLVFLLLGVASCSSGGGGSRPPATLNVTATATSGASSASTAFTITVLR